MAGLSKKLLRSWRKGQVWITATAVLTAVAGWFVYDALMAPRWMRAFGLDVAARATIVSSLSNNIAFSSLKDRPDPDSPYICMSKSATFPWQRVYIVPSGGTIPENLTLIPWPDEDVDLHQSRLNSDDRYQLIVFVDDDQVVEYGYYFTIWADLSALGHTNGFARDEAVFSAESNGEIYRLQFVEEAPYDVCALP